MAERRMLTKKVTDSDEFVALPASAQALYLHLNMAADDDGFNNQIQLAMFKSHASIDDLKVLMMKRFIIRFESGVIVIKHWRMSNLLRKDRYTPTAFQEEIKQLGIKPNGAYTLNGCQTVAKRLPDGCQMVAAGKDSIDKLSIGNTYKRFTPPSVEEVKAYCNERHNSVDPQSFVDFYTANGWVQGKGKKIKDWKACVRTWERGSGRVSVKVPEFIEQQESGTLPEQEEASEEMIAEIKRLQERFK